MTRLRVSRPARPAASAELSRRQFLVLGSTVAAGAWAGDLLAAAPRNLDWAAVDRDWPLSVGFVEGSEALSDLRALPWEGRGGGPGNGHGAGSFDGPLQVVPAAGMILGDQTLALETVVMGVRALYPGFPPRRQPGFSSTYLTVYVPSPDPLFPDPLPFLSWGSLRLPGRSTGAPTRFLVPLREDGGLEVVLEVRSNRPVSPWGPAQSGEAGTGRRPAPGGRQGGRLRV